MSAPPVCVLTSGRGTRLGARYAGINKALLPLGQKAILTRIIERFPPESPFVVSLGHLGGQVKDYLELAHPDRDFTFVAVDRFEGPGTGPGYSLLQCKPHLERPFYFAACDTLWEGRVEDFGREEDWVGTERLPEERTGDYCNFEVEDGRVLRILDKTPVRGGRWESFIGLCFVRNSAAFWRGLLAGQDGAGEHSVSRGLALVLQEGGLKARRIRWTDVGSQALYEEALRAYDPYDFSKSEEQLYHVGTRGLKFFANPEIARRRAQRGKAHPEVFPRIVGARNQFFAYEYAPGATFYRSGTPELFRRLLAWLKESLWRPAPAAPPSFPGDCLRFHRDKTLERLRAYGARHPADEEVESLDGTPLPRTVELLNRIPWDRLSAGVPVSFHGDLQFDNILYDAGTDRFILLDWRQDFAGLLDCGDLYYDLAKLMGGILLDYDRVKANDFSYREEGRAARARIPRMARSAEYLEILDGFLRAERLDPARVALLVGLIYLNMAPLHTPPFDRLLHALGRRTLAESGELR